MKEGEDKKDGKDETDKRKEETEKRKEETRNLRHLAHLLMPKILNETFFTMS
jgi:hypothetical protein